jgi:hypothetical protein
MDLEVRVVQPTTLEENMVRSVEEPRRSFTALSDTSTLQETSPPRPALPRLDVASARGQCLTDSCPSSPDEIPGIIAAPEQLNETAVRRMTWILQTSMESVLPTLRPEQRKVIEGTTDLTQLIAPLLQSWEQFRSVDAKAGKSRKLAKSMSEKMKSTFSTNELSERFWSRKLSAESEDASWGGFKNLVSGLLEQVIMVDKILNSLNNCLVHFLMNLLRIVYSACSGIIWGDLPLFKGTLAGCATSKSRLRKGLSMLMR